MTYSVWNNATRLYDYYESVESSSIHADAPPVGVRGELGATPEQAAWPLPAGVRRAGSGELPKGRIASTGQRMFHINFVESATYGLLAYLLWKALR